MIDRKHFKSTTILPLLADTIGTALEDFEKYVKEVSSDLRSKQDKVNKAFEDAVGKDYEDEMYHFFYDDIKKYFDVFPLYTFNPLLISIYGFFENWLKRLCNYHTKVSRSQITLDDLSGGNYIEKSKKYLEKIAGLNFAPLKEQWIKIIEIQQVRNRIAHHNSVANKKNAELFQRISNDLRIEFNSQFNTFYLKDQYLIDALELIKSCLVHIVNELSKRYDNY